MISKPLPLRLLFRQPTVLLLPRAKASSIRSQKKCLSTLAANFNDLVSRPASKYQIYVSTCDDPFVNLSIEHHILQKSHPSSTIFFLYVNRPCVVIGRNQNPWLETNLSLLSNPSPPPPPQTTPPPPTSSTSTTTTTTHDEPPPPPSSSPPFPLGNGTAPPHPLSSQTPTAAGAVVELVRRRSGGGTVFHDHGNVNWSVTCPAPGFARDRHAEMIVRAIRRDNPRARVNERHDIVLDMGGMLGAVAGDGGDGDGGGGGGGGAQRRPLDSDYHATGYGAETGVKVSGSAYKLTRTRALHHGTCLVRSPNVGGLGRYLRSPAREYIKAKGVDSVRSPVSNVYPMGRTDALQVFCANAIAAFAQMYQVDNGVVDGLSDSSRGDFIETFSDGVVGRVGQSLTEIDEIATGIREMKSLDWLYGQTPQFTFSTHPTEEDPRQRPKALSSLLEMANVHLKARRGAIEDIDISLSDASFSTTNKETSSGGHYLRGTKLHEIESWENLVGDAFERDSQQTARELGRWMDALFGKRNMPSA